MLDLATKVAASSDQKFRHGAVLVRNGNVLAVGVNKRRNSPESLEDKDTIMRHASVCAERDALRRVSDAQGATIYVARVGRNGKPAWSRPCERCAKALSRAGVKTVIFTD